MSDKTREVRKAAAVNTKVVEKLISDFRADIGPDHDFGKKNIARLAYADSLATSAELLLAEVARLTTLLAGQESLEPQTTAPSAASDREGTVKVTAEAEDVNDIVSDSVSTRGGEDRE